ncbi:inosine triphosphate pyrophosphatase-like isoform X2 [Tripterygium wilfordii]|uniref:inosine triphosphate pyrophosphatase-like isoform X2 n=1 Tax=Tripterygium wilfordii TaxID=458696 RepID=UPI0018F82FBA|nr:inosine triphosphate pyrophosphatase-like isoform X2 [Tripterygium wilfordii]
MMMRKMKRKLERRRCGPSDRGHMFNLVAAYILPVPDPDHYEELCARLNNLLMAYKDKSAYALCAFSFALGTNVEPTTFLGKTLGKVVHDFGWDPIFQPDGFELTDAKGAKE